MHVKWCMPGSLTSGCLWSQLRGKRSGHSRCMRNAQFCISGERSMAWCHQATSHYLTQCCLRSMWIVICHLFPHRWMQRRVQRRWWSSWQRRLSNRRNRSRRWGRRKLIWWGNKLRWKQKGSHLADNIFKFMFLIKMEHTWPCLLCIRIWTTCTISVSSNDRKSDYIFMFSKLFSR